MVDISQIYLLTSTDCERIRLSLNFYKDNIMVCGKGAEAAFLK